MNLNDVKEIQVNMLLDVLIKKCGKFIDIL
jgi:hypothetical protein